MDLVNRVFSITHLNIKLCFYKYIYIIFFFVVKLRHEIESLKHINAALRENDGFLEEKQKLHMQIAVSAHSPVSQLAVLLLNTYEASI